MPNLIPYEILIRGENGQFKGAHVVHAPGDGAAPIAEAQWPAICAAINTAALEKATAYDATAAALKEHQDLTDEGMRKAGPLVAALVAMKIPEAVQLAAIFAQFAQFSSRRAAAKAGAAVEEARAALAKAEAEAAALQA